MKVLASQAVDIRAPAELVFDYVCDLSRWPMWFACVVSAEQSAARPLARGEEIHVCMHAGRRRWHEDFEVTRFIRNAFLSFEALFSTARRIDFRFERRGRLTRLACSIGYRVFGGLLPLAYDLLLARWRVRRVLHDSLVHLKNVLEETCVTPVFGADLEPVAVAKGGQAGRTVAGQTLRVV